MHLTLEIVCFPQVAASCYLMELVLEFYCVPEERVFFSGGGDCTAVHCPRYLSEGIQSFGKGSSAAPATFCALSTGQGSKMFRSQLSVCRLPSPRDKTAGQGVVGLQLTVKTASPSV